MIALNLVFCLFIGSDVCFTFITYVSFVGWGAWFVTLLFLLFCCLMVILLVTAEVFGFDICVIVLKISIVFVVEFLCL